MVTNTSITLPNFSRGFHLITTQIANAIQLPSAGLLTLFIQHTSAGLTLNENADPSVRVDFEQIFNRLVTEGAP